MTTVVLALVVAGVLAFHGWQAREWTRERARLIAAALAPTPFQAQVAVNPTPPAPRRDDSERPTIPIAVGDDA